MKINDNALKCCLHTLDNWCNFQPTEDQLRSVVNLFPAFLMEMNTFYITVEQSYGLDTVDREELLDILSMHFLKQRWPLCGDRAGMDGFSNRLTDAVKAVGWKVGS